jgi:hypothetical protein
MPRPYITRDIPFFSYEIADDEEYERACHDPCDWIGIDIPNR